ncbi:MAG TPA: peptidoglycan DD-metalloendopeptidase family protein [Candidatus Limnocylindrales bacterium]|nr:peptidoglycan DD-metalloendopeptidase family protein [Candidatus Limnocylindrales bacterium]
MRRALGAAAIVGALLALQASSASATDPSPSPSPSPCPGAAASGSRNTCPGAPTDPNQAAYAQLESRLGGDIAKALATEQRIAATLDQFARTEQLLTDEVAQEEAVISDLEDKIAQLDTQIADTLARIDVEKEQLAAMSRAIYRQPDSFWILIARSGNLHEALIATADAVVAGQRAHDLQTRLEADLAKLQADRQAKQDDLDKQNATLDLLNANLNALDEVMSQQDDLSSQLDDLVSQIQDAKDQLRDQPPDVTNQLAQLLEAQEQDLVQRSYQTAWSQAQVGIGLAMVNNKLPVGKTIQGLNLSWPMVSFQITQPFGPSSVLLEPPYGPYKHFHTGVDLAAPLGTPVMAAADGLVVAVGHGNLGYGNYIVIAHGGGVATLYGHLLQTDVNAGDRVVRGEVIGLEGSTGYSTGPHVHFELRVNDQVIDPMPYLPVPGTSWSG